MANKTEKARICSDCSSMVIVREGMDVSSQNICRVPVGTIVKAIKVNSDWSKIQSDKNIGFVMNRFLVYGETK